MSETKSQRKPDKRNLNAGWHQHALRELAALLGVEKEAVPVVFLRSKPRALKIGIRDDIIQKYGVTDAKALGVWLGTWCATKQYLKRIVNGQNRHDLDGNDCGTISEEAKAQALASLQKRRARQKMKRMAAETTS